MGPFTLRHLVTLAGVLAAGAALLVVLGAPIASPAPAVLPAPGSGFYRLGEPTEGLAIGQLAPELVGVDGGAVVGLVDLDGIPVRLAELRGAPVWLSFFATWCPPCQEETPVLRAAHARHGPRGLGMVAVSVQDTSAADVRDYAGTYGLSYRIAFDATSAIFRAYQGFGLPTHVFLDAEGIIRWVNYGPLTSADIDRIVEPLLLEARAPATPGAGTSGPREAAAS